MKVFGSIACLVCAFLSIVSVNPEVSWGFREWTLLIGAMFWLVSSIAFLVQRDG